MLQNLPSLTYRRNVRPTDREKIAGIIASTDFFSPEEFDIAIELLNERLEKGIKSGYFFLFAELSGVVIGYSCFDPIPGTLASYDLYWIAVQENYQRLGIGKKILAKTEKLIAARRGSKIYADTSSRRQYESTRRFYQDCAYRQCALLEDFYAPGDGKVIFVKDI